MHQCNDDRNEETKAKHLKLPSRFNEEAVAENLPQKPNQVCARHEITININSGLYHNRNAPHLSKSYPKIKLIQMNGLSAKKRNLSCPEELHLEELHRMLKNGNSVRVVAPLNKEHILQMQAQCLLVSLRRRMFLLNSPPPRLAPEPTTKFRNLVIRNGLGIRPEIPHK